MNAPAKIPVKQTVAAPGGPFHLFGSLQREIDRLFDDFMPAFAGGYASDQLKCKMDLAETKDGFELTAELPGMDEKDVQVEFNDGVLTLRGEKRYETESKDKTYHFSERGYGAFFRTLDLPSGVDPKQIKATLAKGVLKVTIPTPGRAEPKRISVETAG